MELILQRSTTVIPMYQKIFELLKYTIFPKDLHQGNIKCLLGAHLSTSLGHTSQKSEEMAPKLKKKRFFRYIWKTTIAAKTLSNLIFRYVIELNPTKPTSLSVPLQLLQLFLNKIRKLKETPFFGCFWYIEYMASLRRGAKR